MVEVTVVENKIVAFVKANWHTIALVALGVIVGHIL